MNTFILEAGKFANRSEYKCSEFVKTFGSDRMKCQEN